MKMFSKLSLYIHTLLNLKAKQLLYQFYYRLHPRTYVVRQKKTLQQIDPVLFSKYFTKDGMFVKDKFRFLNLEKLFEKEIDWDFQEYGKLWNYNLQYFDYLFQEDLKAEKRLDLLKSFYRFIEKNKIPLEPYPVSLRAINSIKFYSQNQIQDEELLGSLYQELHYLNHHYEFHLLGNHVLENGFAMLLGGAFFQNKKWENKAKETLIKELDEQILKDGCHFELSPMYHKIILFRLLELIDWYGNYEKKDESFLMFLKNKAQIMLSFLYHIQFKNGDIPHFNDSADGIALSNKALIEYSRLLQIEKINLPLGESGYRSFEFNEFELKADTAQLAVDYQPGHAHADALSFILYHNNKPFIVEMGTSTYQIGERRQLERGTVAHNTVTINREDQSRVWGGFRIGKRAKTKILTDNPQYLKATHDGYKEKYNVIHQREFQISDELLIVDNLNNQTIEAEAFLHFAPGFLPYLCEDSICFENSDLKIQLKGFLKVKMEAYEMADGFNKYRAAQKVVISFINQLTTRIYLTQQL